MFPQLKHPYNFVQEHIKVLIIVCDGGLSEQILLVGWTGRAEAAEWYGGHACSTTDSGRYESQYLLFASLRTLRKANIWLHILDVQVEFERVRLICERICRRERLKVCSWSSMSTQEMPVFLSHQISPWGGYGKELTESNEFRILKHNVSW